MPSTCVNRWDICFYYVSAMSVNCLLTVNDLSGKSEVNRLKRFAAF